MSVVTNCLAEH